MDARKIVVCASGNEVWTLQALHLACTLARDTQATLELIKMVPVQHPGWLNSDFGYMNFTYSDEERLAAYQQIAEDYSVLLSICLFQYSDLADAIGQAVEESEAKTAFATLPPYQSTWWRKFQLYRLEHKLKKHGCTVYTLEKSPHSPEWPAYIQVAPAHR